MIHSFRLRLALLSAVLTGLVLILFGSASWWLVRQGKLQAQDSELGAYAEHALQGTRSDAEWEQDAAQLRARLGVADTQDLLLLQVSRSGETLYRSSAWPDAWSDAALPWPEPAPHSPAQQGSSRGAQDAQDALARTWQAVPAPFSQAQAAVAAPEAATQAQSPRTDGQLAQAGTNAERPPLPRPATRSAPGQAAPAGARSRPPLLPPHRSSTAAGPEAAGNAATSDSSSAAGSSPAPASALAPAPAPAPAAAPEAQPTARQAPALARPIVLRLEQRERDGQVWRLALAQDDATRFAVAVNLRAVDADMRHTRNALLFSLPLALALTGAASWLLAARALRPVEKLVQATRSMTVGDLDQRIAIQGSDREFVELIAVFNRMLARLERSFRQAHRFSADAAHELKTPLAIVQGQLERALQLAPDASPLQRLLGSVLDEMRRLSTISSKLLLLAQADAGRLTIVRETMDLSHVLADLAEDSRMLAPQLRIDAEIQPGLLVQGDASLLRQVLHNLISNAIKYNVAGGWIRISVARWSHSAEVLVSNASEGIAPAQRERLFERFFRADQAHGRSVEGVGLGLSVAREIARAHGGDLTLKSVNAGSVQFSLLLPV